MLRGKVSILALLIGVMLLLGVATASDAPANPPTQGDRMMWNVRRGFSHRHMMRGRSGMGMIMGFKVKLQRMLKELDPASEELLTQVISKVRGGEYPRLVLPFAISQYQREYRYFILAERAERLDPEFARKMKELIKSSLEHKRELIQLYIKYMNTTDSKEEKYLEEKMKLKIRSLLKLSSQKRRLAAEYLEKHLDALTSEAIEDIRAFKRVQRDNRGRAYIF